jgi:hypothetical protein
MRIQLLAVLSALAVPASGLAAPEPDQTRRGGLESVSAASTPGTTLAALMVRGANPCRQLLFDFGDGTSARLTIDGLPVTMRHVYGDSGVYRATVTGVGACQGRVETTVHLGSARTYRPAPDVGTMRILGMDRNGDGVITRAEWRGNARSFDVHDVNDDGILSGTELRSGPPAAAGGDHIGAAGQRTDFENWSAARLRELAPDGIVTPAERRAFIADLFASLDTDGNRIVSGPEWHWTPESFTQLDRDGNGVLTRAEIGMADYDIDQLADAGRPVVVSSTDRWTDTRIVVGAGDVLTFDANGTIQLSRTNGDVASPAGSATGRLAALAPLSDAPAGALIARVGASEPFLVGSDRTPFRSPASGVLYLSVNDDHLGDNRGAFEVRVTVIR